MVAPVQPIGRTAITPKRQAAQHAASLLGGGGSIAGILWLWGLPGEYIVAATTFGVWVLGVVARWARDMNHYLEKESGKPPSLPMRFLAAMGCLFLCISLSGCAGAWKIGPGPYGWFMVQGAIMDTANVKVKALGSELQVGEEGKQASQPGAPDSSQPQ